MNFSIVDIKEICVQAIKEYLNRPLTDEEIREKYRVALEVMVEETQEIMRNKTLGVTQVSQGSQSMSFDSNVQAFKVNDTVKALLPKPYIKLF
ncbi:MAG: hypothetical protein J6D47_19720 [Peptostreptococcaceae bacterium]|nr:hypothetical protein [Peptostreptococcaceae bacterium]